MTTNQGCPAHNPTRLHTWLSCSFGVEAGSKSSPSSVSSSRDTSCWGAKFTLATSWTHGEVGWEHKCLMGMGREETSSLLTWIPRLIIAITLNFLQSTQNLLIYPKYSILFTITAFKKSIKDIMSYMKKNKSYIFKQFNSPMISNCLLPEYTSSPVLCTMHKSYPRSAAFVESSFRNTMTAL